MSGRPQDDPMVVAWAKNVVESMVPAMEGSEVCITFAPEEGREVDRVLYWTELGAMICMDKPILVVVLPGCSVPPKLAKVADEIVWLPEGVSPESSGALASAVERMTHGR